MPIHELYGMSECTGPQNVNLPGAGKAGKLAPVAFTLLCVPNTCLLAAAAGTSGRPIPGSQLRIDKPDDQGNGEILMSGRHMFMGYLNDAARTAQAITEDGFIRSGDLGRIDADG